MSTATSASTPDPGSGSGSGSGPGPSRAPHSDVPTSHRPDGDGRVGGGLFDPRQLVRSLPDALRKLDPRVMVKSPVMFVVEIGSVFTTVLAITEPGEWFGWAIAAWLWLTTIFANLAEAVAEGRGKAQADTLRKAKTDSVARRLTGRGAEPVKKSGYPAPNCASGTWSSARPATSSPVTAMSWRSRLRRRVGHHR